MKRTKEWWERLTKAERSELYWLERAGSSGYGGGGYLPDDCSECGYCSQPFLGSGDLCLPCLHRLIELCDKADAKEEEKI
jgi:hypothetical protein